MIVYRLEHKNGDGIWFNVDGSNRKASLANFEDDDIRGWTSCCRSYNELRSYFSGQEWSKYRKKGCVVVIYDAKDVSDYYDKSKNYYHLVFKRDSAKRIKIIGG